MAIEAVVFDIGNVLVEWNPERFYDAEIGLDRRRALFAETGIEAMNDRIDRGAPFRETVYAEADATPGWAAEIRLWHDRWIEMFAPEIPGSVALLRALRAHGVPVYALTNFGVDSFALAETRYPFLKEFDACFVSGALREVKPEPAIYAALERETGRAPGTLLFADDKPENIAAAVLRGWHGHVFDGPEGWARRLRAEGLLPREEAA